MNLMGLDLNGVGNHEFDEGPVELLRMQQGGHHPEADDVDGEPFRGADFQFLAGNVIDDGTGNTIFPSYAVHEFQGIKVAFIGLTLEGTPRIVARSGVAGLSFHDEAVTVNSLVPRLQEEGIQAIVVLLHQGGFSDGGSERLRGRSRRPGCGGHREVGPGGGPGDCRPYPRRIHL